MTSPVFCNRFITLIPVFSENEGIKETQIFLFAKAVEMISPIQRWRTNCKFQGHFSAIRIQIQRIPSINWSSGLVQELIEVTLVSYFFRKIYDIAIGLEKKGFKKIWRHLIGWIFGSIEVRRHLIDHYVISPR